MKKRITLSSILFLLFIALHAQNKYCRSYTDFLNDKWIPIDSLTENTYADSLQILNGKNNCQPQTGNEEIDKIVEREVRFIQCDNNLLYINCRGLKYDQIKIGNGYAPGFRFEKDKICFISRKINLDKKEYGPIILPLGLLGGAIIGGIVGGIRGYINSLPHTDKYACYLIRSDDNKAFPITSQYMIYLLSPYPEILDEYEQLEETEMESVEIILRFLDHVRILNKY